jgi:hypothetical protein
MIRPQYHFRKTPDGTDAWNVSRLIELSSNISPTMIVPMNIRELKLDHWYSHERLVPTPKSIIKHIELINRCDLSFPIILDQYGNVMDGMHRVCKAILEKVPEIPAVQFEVDPEPDFRNCDPADLPYDV